MKDDAWEVAIDEPPPDLAVKVSSDEGQLRIWSDADRPISLLREALLPPILLGTLFLLVIFLAMQDVTWESPLLFSGVPLGIFMIIRGFLDWRQNGGVTTSVEIRDGFLSCTMRNYWGERVIRWPVSEVTDVKVRSFIVRIYRRWHVPLGSIGYLPSSHLEWIAKLIKARVEQQRSSN